MFNVLPIFGLNWLYNRSFSKPYIKSKHEGA